MNEIAGLPAHILLVHAVVVLAPLSALTIIASGVWPAARRRLGLVTPILAVVVAVLVPITASAGMWLLPRVGGPPPAVEHGDLGSTLWYFSTAMAAIAIVQHLWFRRVGDKPREQRPAPVVGVIIVILAVVISSATVVRTIQVGDSGSRAVWEESYRSD